MEGMRRIAIGLAVVAALAVSGPGTARADDGALPSYLRDRGPGVATSIRGVYLRSGQVVAVPFFQRYVYRAYQYNPSEIGVSGGPDQDFLGDLRISQGGLFLGYGLTNDLALGLDVATGTATFRKAPDDPSATPARLEESGVSDLRAEFTWRFVSETAERPEWFAFGEALIPHDSGNVLIGTPNVVLHPGIGVIRGFPWATLMGRASFEYDAGSGTEIDFDKWSVEGMRRFSPAWWASTGVEGRIGGANNFDEVWYLANVQWNPRNWVGLELGGRVGLTTITEGYAVDAGLVLRGLGDR